jgi:hypothetical protein
MKSLRWEKTSDMASARLATMVLVDSYQEHVEHPTYSQWVHVSIYYDAGNQLFARSLHSYYDKTDIRWQVAHL